MKNGIINRNTTHLVANGYNLRVWKTQEMKVFVMKLIKVT